MCNAKADIRKQRAALYMLLCLVISAIGGIGSAVIKARRGEGIGSHALFLALLLFCGVVLSRLLGVHPSRQIKPAGGRRAEV
jgi:hypothetical protein